jgi:hypothetical protein
VGRTEGRERHGLRRGRLQCAENHGGWALADFDILLVIAPNGLTGGWNGTATVNGHPINTGFVGDSAGACQWQTTYAGHEVVEAQTDGISADCCDGELPFQTAACHAPTQSYGGADAHACAKFAPSGCCDNGVCSSDPWGVRTVSCGGATYQYQMVSPAGHESDGTCKTLTDAVGPAGGERGARDVLGRGGDIVVARFGGAGRGGHRNERAGHQSNAISHRAVLVNCQLRSSSRRAARSIATAFVQRSCDPVSCAQVRRLHRAHSLGGSGSVPQIEPRRGRDLLSRAAGGSTSAMLGASACEVPAGSRALRPPIVAAARRHDGSPALRWSRYDAVASAPRRSRLGRPPPLPLVRRARSSSGLTNWPV